MLVKYIISSLVLLSTVTACDIVVDSPRNPYPPIVDIGTNYPILHDAMVNCRWDNYYQDYIWEFDAWTDHTFGPREIADVWVDVWQGPRLVNSFPLYHDNGSHWDSYWIEWSETNLYCGDRYEFEFTAYDWHGVEDHLLVF
jgi:hypothetical protein